MYFPLCGSACGSPAERGRSVGHIGKGQVFRHTATDGIGGEIHSVRPIGVAIRRQGTILADTCHIGSVGSEHIDNVMIAAHGGYRNPASVGHRFISQLYMVAAVQSPTEMGRHVGHLRNTQKLRNHAVVIVIEHETVNSQEVDSRRQQWFGKETEITSSIVIGGKVYRKAGHGVGRAIRNGQHRIERGEVANRVGGILADTDNQVGIERGVVSRFASAESHLKVIHREVCVKRVLQHSPCLASTIQVKHTGKVTSINVVRTNRGLVGALEMPACRLCGRSGVMGICLKVLPPGKENYRVTRLVLCRGNTRHCQKNH